MARRRRGPRRQVGDYIPSWWEDDYNREEYVYGHVDGDVVRDVLVRELELQAETPVPVVRHEHMRLGFAGEGLRAEGCEREFYKCGPGPGAMPVTVVDYSALSPWKKKLVGQA